jgi:uncharacterized phage protein (TIGR02216 family)
MTPFPWQEAMRLGLGLLRLPPDAFWHMTPRELAAAAGALGSSAHPIDRARLDDLQRQFPDRVSNTETQNG